MSFALSDVKKNGLLGLRHDDIGVSGPPPTHRARSGCRQSARLPRVRVSPALLPELRRRETRDPGMAGPIGPLYAAVRGPHRAAVPRDDGDAGGRTPSPGLGPGLAHGDELHAPLAGASSPVRASSGHRRRRVLGPQRPPVSAGGGGSGSAKADLARGLWPNRRRSANVL